MNNYWHTNYRAAQGGHFDFRYIMTSAPSIDAGGLSRMGWEEVTPLEEDEIRSQDKALDLPRPLDSKAASFLSVDDPNLLLETWKPAEDGDGTILRFLDIGGAPRTVTISTPLVTIQKAFEADAVERNQKLLPLHGSDGFLLNVRPHEILTVRLTGARALSAPME
jgi:alpha-mannosidase